LLTHIQIIPHGAAASCTCYNVSARKTFSLVVEAADQIIYLTNES